MIKQKPVNTNSKRSISLLVETLLKLMKNKSFRDITISEITKEAGLVRNTFYAHFKSKEDIISYYMYIVFKSELETLISNNDTASKDLVSLFYEIWVKKSEFLILLKENEMLNILNEFEKHIELLGLDVYIFEFCKVSEKANEYASTFYANALLSILKRWIETGMKESPEELTNIFKELLG